MFIEWYYNEITLTKVKSLKCDKLISFLKSYSDLSYWITPHFCTNVQRYKRDWKQNPLNIT
jgi:hypothetical protein